MTTYSFEQIGTETAKTAWLRKAGGRIASLFTEMRDRSATRHILMRLKDHELRDIGLTKGDVETFGAMPLSGDAVDRLQTRMLRNSQNW